MIGGSLRREEEYGKFHLIHISHARDMGTQRVLSDVCHVSDYRMGRNSAQTAHVVLLLFDVENKKGITFPLKAFSH